MQPSFGPHKFALAYTYPPDPAQRSETPRREGDGPAHADAAHAHGAAPRFLPPPAARATEADGKITSQTHPAPSMMISNAFNPFVPGYRRHHPSE